VKNGLRSALLIVGVGLLAKGLYMDAKAQVAQFLLANSWAQSSNDARPPKPWSWADTRVIATLEVERLGKRLYVMQDDSGESLAFGPGHINASSPINSNGHVMVAGHRDSHFEFLKDLQIGDIIITEGHNKSIKRYQVNDLTIMDTRYDTLSMTERSMLTLITCYPFDDFIPGGTQRFIVNANQIL